MQHDWFMYHLRSTYKNRLDFPFKVIALVWGFFKGHSWQPKMHYVACLPSCKDAA